MRLVLQLAWMIQRHIWIQGRVQGVGFRAATLRMARELSGLRGWVRNLPDGQVEAVVMGDEQAVLAFVAWCQTGPPASRVEGLKVREEPLESELGEFQVVD